MSGTPSPVPVELPELPEDAAEMAGQYAAVSVRIAVIIVVAVLLRFVLRRAIDKVVRRAMATPTVPESLRSRFGEAAKIAVERRRQRTETVGSVLRSVSTIVIFGVAFTTVLGQVGVDLGPILASAGIIGVAVGFGAQNLVRDFLNGIFMILEDQYGVGDAIDVGEAEGIVESVGLRTTRLRNVDGTVWHVRNGEIVRVGNMSQGWSRALLDISVAYGTDVGLAQEVIKRVAVQVSQGAEVGQYILDEPQVWGVEMLGADGIDIRLVVKTAPLEQWKVARELRRRLKEGFDAEGIEIPFPQRALWIRSSSDDAPSPLTDPGAHGARPDVVTRTGEADVARSDTGALKVPGPVSPTGPADDGDDRRA